MKIISKERFDRIPDDYKGTWTTDTMPEWKGRRTAFLPGEGTTLSVEGVHFLVNGDYSHLPVLHKSNARVGECYQFAGGFTRVHKVYRLSEEDASRSGLVYLDRVTTSTGDFALPGGSKRGETRP